MNTISSYKENRNLSPSSRSAFMKGTTEKLNYRLTSPDHKSRHNNANSFYKSPFKFPETTTQKDVNSKKNYIKFSMAHYQ